MLFKFGGGKLIQENTLGLAQQMRDELLEIAEAVRSGKMTSVKGKNLAQILKTALYAEQVNLQSANIIERLRALNSPVAELSPETKAQLDEIAKHLKKSPEPTSDKAKE